MSDSCVSHDTQKDERAAAIAARHSWSLARGLAPPPFPRRPGLWGTARRGVPSKPESARWWLIAAPSRLLPGKLHASEQPPPAPASVRRQPRLEGDALGHLPFPALARPEAVVAGVQPDCRIDLQ